MKIRELVKKTNVPKETIHYYIREGVLRKPKKHGRNAAEYSEEYVEHIFIIKRLQESYYLPLSVIKKILKRQKKKNLQEKTSFQFLSEFLLPVDLLMAEKTIGKKAFRQATGLSARWLDQMEAWSVISSRIVDGERVFSQDDLILGKLIVEMDRLGMGPDHGYDPEDLRRIIDFIREYIREVQQKNFERNIKLFSGADVIEKATLTCEIMSMFFYHAYRKTVREEYENFFQELGQTGK